MLQIAVDVEGQLQVEKISLPALHGVRSWVRVSGFGVRWLLPKKLSCDEI
jgi:hypothetical protein